MGIFRNKVGLKFGRLTVVAYAGSDNHRHSRWQCSCICGKTTIATSCNLTSGEVASCGCGEIENRYTINLRHGHTRGYQQTPEYYSWLAMFTRCTNPNRREWQNYGGRGIKVCQRWMDFENFLADMGPRPVGLSLERMNNDGNYEPGNCKWATAKEQANNRRPRRRRVSA